MSKFLRAGNVDPMLHLELTLLHAEADYKRVVHIDFKESCIKTLFMNVFNVTVLGILQLFKKNADTHGDALDVGMSFENLNSFLEK